MHKFIGIALIASGLIIASSAHAKKPTICLAFNEVDAFVDGKAQKVAICFDSKKPIVLTSYSFAQFKDEDGKPLKGIVGWR